LDPDPSSLSSSVFSLPFALDVPASPALLLISLGLFLLLLGISALFSSSEVILTSSDRLPSELRAGRLGERLTRLLADGRSLMFTILIVNIATTIGAAMIAAMIAGLVARDMGWSFIATQLVQVAAVSTVLIVSSFLVPRLIAPRHSLAIVRTAALPLAIAHRTMAPVSFVMARSSDFFRERLLGGSRRISSEELKSMADLGQEHGTLEESERELIHSIVEFGTMTVREVMVSRLDIVALPVTADIQEAIEIIRDSGHSRLPLYVEHLDNIAGIIYAKDLLPYLGNGETGPINWTRLARAPLFVPASKKLDELLRDFQSKKTHIAIVVDEYGGTAGLVTLEDLLEEIVGDIRDEHDEGEAPMIEEVDPGTYRVDARVNLDDLNEELGIQIDTDRFDFETLGGLIFHLTGAIPEEGEEVEFENLLLRVETVDNHRIGFILVRVGTEGESEDAAAE
jgi:putative hemolysin